MLNLVKAHLLKRSYERQRRSRARDLSLWNVGLNERGHMSIGGLDAVDLLRRFGSPLLVVDHRTLVQHAREIVEALSDAPAGSNVFYSYKTNCVPGILAELHALGIGAEVISPFELWLADRLGIRGDRVIYNGVAKTDDSLDLAVRMRVASINVDTLHEIDRIAAVARRRSARVNVGVRLGLVEKAQFGLRVDNGEAIEACRRIAQYGELLNLRCVHFNVTSNSKSFGDHRGAVVRALEFMAAVRADLGIDVPLLDIGGGFGVPTTKNLSGVEYLLYRGLGVTPSPPNPDDFQPVARWVADLNLEIRRTAARLGCPAPAVAVEPGRFITSRSETLLTKINAIKANQRQLAFAITDVGRLSITFPCDFEYHEVFVANRPMAPVERPYMVTGRVCTSADWLVRNRLLPDLNLDDVLAVMDAGAYFSSYSSNFAFPRPSVVMIKNGHSSVIRHAESFEHLVATDVAVESAADRVATQMP